MRNVPAAVKNIIIINVAVMIMTYLNEPLMARYFALHPYQFIYRPWQLVTYMFMHGGLFHLFFNMYTLFIFGSVLERVWGTKKFLIFYFVTGLGAAAVHTSVEWLQVSHWMTQVAETGSIAAQASIHALKMTPTVGASGAIYGLLMGYAMLYPDSIMSLIFPPISLKAKWFVLIFGAIELLTGLTGAGSGIAHFAHLGGLIFGFILIMYWKKKRTLYGNY